MQFSGKKEVCLQKVVLSSFYITEIFQIGKTNRSRANSENSKIMN